MLTGNANDYLSKTAKALCFGSLLTMANTASAVTADDVMNKMNDDQRGSYIAGVVEALAFSRWLSDKPEKSGMDCIHNWLYGEESESSIRSYFEWFDRHPEKPAAPLLYLLIKKECGE